MNVKLLRKVAKHILAEPRRIYMEQYCVRSSDAPCGTAGCIAAWGAILGGEANRTQDCWQPKIGWFIDGLTALSLNEVQANRLFKLREQCSAEQRKRGE